jgi:hypothetical protein
MFAKQLILFENMIFMNVSNNYSFYFTKNVIGKKKLNIISKSKIACAQVIKVL